MEWSMVILVEQTLPYLAGVKISEFYLNPHSCVLVFERGRPRVEEIFGNSVPHLGVSCPHLSYGHVACLGCKIIFPKDSEPCARPAFASLDDGIEALEKEINFSANPLFNHYLNIYDHLRNAFPDERMAFSGFGWEGPFTSAVLLRGQSFFIDVHKEPDKAREFLKLVTASIIEYIHFIRDINRESKVNPYSSGLCDDFASFIPPSMWSKFVIPYWDQYDRGITTGKRNLHCENMSPDHLRYLSELVISSYDPALSPKLSPQIIRELTNIPFDWWLPSFDLLTMTKEEVREWVIQTAIMGASNTGIEICKLHCDGDNPEKIAIFVNTAKEIAAR